MSVTTQKSSDGKTIIIKTGNKFNYSSRTDFRNSYSNQQGSAVSYVIDMQNTDCMDSSALGMLLLLREHIGSDGNKVSIINCSEEIKNIFGITNFHELFHIM